MPLKRFVYFIVAASLVLSTGTVAFAGDTPPIDESKFVPKVKLSSASTIEVREGRQTEVEIEVKNVGTGRAAGFFISVAPEADCPFSIAYEILGGSDSIAIGASKRIKLKINVDANAAAKVYPVTLNFSFKNDYKAGFTETDTLNVKVLNPLQSGNIRLYDFELFPASLRAGETGELSFKYMNMGSADERNAKIYLDGLDAAAITVPDGLAALDIPLARTYTEEKASFLIKAAAGVKNGSYPIKIVSMTRNPAGEPVTEEIIYYIGVGGSSASGAAAIDIINPSAPTGTFGVGENIGISFELFNSSKYDAENVLVKANASDGGEIVPTSQSMFMTRVLSAGETKRFSFAFAATSAAKSQNYPVSFTIEYDAEGAGTDGGTGKISFSQYFGVNISNPEKDDEDKSESKNVPKIIVSSYSCEPTIVKAGGEFNLSMTFMNSHPDKLVRNIKVSLTVTDKDEKAGASIFSPVRASNTLYIDSIAPQQTESRSIRYYAVPDASPQTYSINVNFEYEDAEGNPLKEQEIVGINVSQPPSIETSDINLPEFGETGVPLFVNFEIYNTGKVTVNNLKVIVEGNMQADSGKTTWIGNMDSGMNEWIDTSFYFLEPGEQAIKIIVSYDSPTGEHFEIPKDFTVQINEPMPMDMGEFPQDMPPDMGEGGFISKYKKPLLIGGGVAVVIIAGGGFVLYRRMKKKQKDNDFYE